MPFRRLLALTALSLAAAVACSSDPYAPKASYPVNAGAIRVLALNQTPPEAESGVGLFSRSTAVPDFSEQFDFALDIDAGGNVVIIPRSKVVRCSSICQLGMRLVRPDSVKFEELYDAPKSGYVYDSVTTLPIGTTVVFVTKEVLCRPSNLSTYDLYAKMIVDSVHLAERAIYARVVSDPNCGFRGLVPDVVPGH